MYWINRLPYLCELLESLQLEHIAPTKPDNKKDTYQLIKDVETRWNSFDDSAVRALYLRLAIDELMLQVELEHRRKHPNTALPAIFQDRLTADDWYTITQYHKILKPIKGCTILLQGYAGGRFGAIWQVLPVYEHLLAHFEKLKKQYPTEHLQQSRRKPYKTTEDQHQSQLTFDTLQQATTAAVALMLTEQLTSEHYLITNINLGWLKLDKYYTKLDDTPVYVTATVLHPAMKWKWIEKR